MQVPLNFRFRGILRDDTNKPLSNILVSVMKPDEMKYMVFTDDNGVFALAFTDTKPQDVSFIVNQTQFALNKLPDNMATYSFVLDRTTGYLTCKDNSTFQSSDAGYKNMMPIVQYNALLLGIATPADAFYLMLSLFLLVVAVGIWVIVGTSVADENISM